MEYYQKINKLIRKDLSGTPTPEESRIFTRWLNESEDNKILFQEMQKIWRERSSEPKLINTDELAEKIWSRAFENKSTAFSTGFDWQNWLKVAAVISIFIISIFIIYSTQDNIPPAKEIKPLSDCIINKVPSGQKLKIILPDGSNVRLNSESTLTYNLSDFDFIKKVELSGEGFFEVVKDSTREFKVKSGDLHTIALGTSFNISAYNKQNFEEISLVEGKSKKKKKGCLMNYLSQVMH